jgi:hypothetical protein
MDAVVAKPIDLTVLVQAMNAATPSNDEKVPPKTESQSGLAPMSLPYSAR